MSPFLTGVSDDLQEECHSSMLHENMNIYRLMVHPKHVEDARAKRKSRDAKRAISFDGGSSYNRLEIQEKPRFKKRVPNGIPSMFYKATDNRVYNSNHKKGKTTSSPAKKPTCENLGRNYGHWT